MEYIKCFIYLCVCVCLVHGQPIDTSASCIGVQCSPPNCLDPYTPLDGCCPVCPGPGRPCLYRGRSYNDGESFMNDCNTCICTDGDIGCSQMFCPDDKPGSCPLPKGLGTCVESCTADVDCPRKQKCCSNGCGHTCMKPKKAKPCIHKGVKYRDGASFNDDCNTCTCTNGLTSCTEMACLGKPGSCPILVGSGGLCVETCTDDYSCSGAQKCCSNGCGHTCMKPISEGQTCLYRGISYNDGESFMNDCNTCTCTNGEIGCTQMFCPDDKPGSCPLPKGLGTCVESCTADVDCPRKQKCCSNGCGHTCMKPKKAKPCIHKGVKYRDGASFKDDCNTCTCDNGLTSCTEMACHGKPGNCPILVGSGGICVETCTDDFSCAGAQKCCSNGCGHTCMKPISEGTSCYYKGITYRDGEKFMDDCNTCLCRNGNAGCTKKACPKLPCFHNGINYNDGQTFRDDCNICICTDGTAECTLMTCPDVKPGTCPPSIGVGICVDRCTTDLSCPGREKCCSNGCGTVCLPPENGGQPCFYKGKSYNDGETFKDYCNSCVCNDGAAACTRMACPDVKPGECPPPLGIGSCMDMCTVDSSCPGTEKCCSNGCGNLCLPPRIVGRPCVYNGVTYNDGERFDDSCNTCTCTDGNAVCTQRACPGAPCMYKGISYNHGETFKDDCNTCNCNDGRTVCTLMACPDTKPGTCPPGLGIGICVQGCTTDASCPGREKCCSNGCGTTCMLPDTGGRPCVYNGVTYNDGERFDDSCNTCTCTDGDAVCTQMACPGAPCMYKGITYNHGETFKDDCNTCNCNDGRTVCTLMSCPDAKPGMCPPAVGIGICVHRCTTDASCPGREKCCSNGCGTTCMLPETGGRPCMYNGLTYSDGERFKDDCNTCTCSDGNVGCTKRACPGTPCVYKGITYNHGQTFKDECNTCTCNDGRAACTLMACPDEKPGNCPPAIGVGGICVHRCTTDLSCPDREKCCSNGCGTICTLPVKGRPCYHNGVEYPDGASFKDDCNTCRCIDGKAGCTKIACRGSCMHNGIIYKDGESFKDDCNTCTCSSGNAVCTLMACPTKPGTCPVVTGGGICLEECNGDSSCTGIQKCCSNGCGHVCINPDFVGRPCLHNGYNYTDGESFKDDCNTCKCTNGNVACTLMACPPKQQCYHNGVIRQDGEKFQIECNTCVCTDGRVLCTYKQCGQTCVYKGKTYQDGESFKESCNTCTCSNGNVACTLLECSGEKPGRCPRQALFSSCFHRCNGDNTCPGKKKCCNNWCGNTCMDPIGGDSCADVACPAIECPNGYTPHTPPGRCCPICRPPIGEKPGTCPRRPRRGPCVDICTSDFSCPGQQKCCSNRCGRSCMRPIRYDRCDSVSCPPLGCRVQFRPRGQCCPVCRRRRGRE